MHYRAQNISFKAGKKSEIKSIYAQTINMRKPLNYLDIQGFIYYNMAIEIWGFVPLKQQKHSKIRCLGAVFK